MDVARIERRSPALVLEALPDRARIESERLADGDESERMIHLVGPKPSDQVRVLPYDPPIAFAGHCDDVHGTAERDEPEHRTPELQVTDRHLEDREHERSLAPSRHVPDAPVLPWQD